MRSSRALPANIENTRAIADILPIRVDFSSTFFFFFILRRPPRSTLDRSSAASDVYKRQGLRHIAGLFRALLDERGATHFAFDGGDEVAQHHRTRISQVVQGVPIALFTVQRRAHTPDDIVHIGIVAPRGACLLYTSPSPRDRTRSRIPSSP